MDLSHSQKKYLKKNLKKFSLEKIAQDLHLEEKEILTFLKQRWGRKKYQKFIQSQKNERNQNLTLSEEKSKTKFSLNFKDWFKKNWKSLLFLAFLVIISYAGTLNHEFLSDDFPAIRNNEKIGNPFWYLVNQPSTFFRYFLYYFIYKIGGINPLGFRLLNIFFHLGTVFTVYLLISLLNNSFVALLTAGLFAVHPIEIESITWISGGPHSQYSFFLMIAFILYLLAKRNLKPLKLLVSSLFFFLLALMTTEKSGIFPLILLFYELSLRKFRINWKRLIPFFSLAAFWGLLIISLGNLSGKINALQAQYYQKTGELNNPFIQIPIAISSYLKLLIWPDKLTLYHSEMNFTQSQYWLMVIITIVFFALIILSYRKSKQIFFWGSLFIISLIPTLTPLRVGWVVAERYVYFGSIGIIFIVALGLKKIGALTKNKIVTWAIFGLLILSLTTRTIIRNRDWQNQDTLWLSAAKTSPSSHQNHNNLGDLYARRREFDKAVEEFKKAIELKPDYGDAYHNLANVYHQQQKDDLALESYQKAIQLNPNIWQSYQNIGAIYFIQKKYDLALSAIQKAVEINPNESSLRTNLGIALSQLGENEKAKEEFKKSLEINPQDEIAKKWLELLNDK